MFMAPVADNVEYRTQPAFQDLLPTTFQPPGTQDSVQDNVTKTEDRSDFLPDVNTAPSPSLFFPKEGRRDS